MNKFQIGDVLAGSSLGSKSMGLITNELFDLAGDHAKSLKEEYLNLQTVNTARSDNNQPIEDSLEIEVSFQNDLIEINQLFAFKSLPHHKVIDPQEVMNDINAYTDDDNFEDFITVISDHGNITLYSWDGTEYKEVWSIV